MATFHGTLRLAAEPDAVHSATVILVDDRFVLRAGGTEVGDWPLQDLGFDYAGEEIRVRIDGDEALLSMPERGAFAAAVGLSESGLPAAREAAAMPLEVATEPPAPSEATPEAAPSAEPPLSAVPPDALYADAEAAAAPEMPTEPQVSAGFAGAATSEVDGTTAAAEPPVPAEPDADFGVGFGDDQSAETEPPAAAATADVDETTAAAEPLVPAEPDADFGVGFGGDQSAETEPLATAPEPGFTVAAVPPPEPTAPSSPTAGTASAAQSTPWEQPMPEPGTAPPTSPAGAASDLPLTGVESSTSAPPTPWGEPTPQPDLDLVTGPPASPEDPPAAPESRTEVAQGESAAHPGEAMRAPSASSPPDAEPMVEPFGSTSPPTDSDPLLAASMVPSTTDETPPDPDDTDIGEPASEPEGRADDELPVAASAAAAAVWSVRSQPDTTDAETDDPMPAGTAGDLGRDDLVAARLAAQRQTTLGGEEDHAAGDISETGPDSESDALVEPIAAPATQPDAPADEAEEDPDKRFDRLRSQSAAGYFDDETLRKWVAWGLLVGGVLIGVGAFLTWGDTRMFDTDFPVARAISALAALAAVAGFVLGFFMHRRTQGAYVAGTGAVLGLMTLVIYARAAGIGTGFFLALLGVLVVAGLSVLAVTPAGGSTEKRSGR